MTKAWCTWCETGQIPKHGYFWIHPECFHKVTEIAMDINAVIEYMKGIRPKEHDSRRTVDAFITDMYDFHRRWRNTTKLFKAYNDGTPLDQVEFEMQSPNQKVNKE